MFAHQRLDVGSPYGVKNAPGIRKILENSGKVRAVFQGHSHSSDYKEIGGIHYCTLVAMVEGSEAASNGYSTISVLFPCRFRTIVGKPGDGSRTSSSRAISSVRWLKF